MHNGNMHMMSREIHTMAPLQPTSILLIDDNLMDIPKTPQLPILEDTSSVPCFLSLTRTLYFGFTPSTSMHLTRLIYNHPVSIFVYSGSTHNLIHPNVASLLWLLFNLPTLLPVLVGNSDPLQCEGFFLEGPLVVDKAFFKVLPFHLALKTYKLILGFEWLHSLGLVTADFTVPLISFVRRIKL